jgi:hypothetical protein
MKNNFKLEEIEIKISLSVILEIIKIFTLTCLFCYNWGKSKYISAQFLPKKSISVDGFFYLTHNRNEEHQITAVSRNCEF